MEFKSYNSLDNITQSLVNGAILYNDTMWCAREKIHGTNYQMSYDGSDFKSGSRTQFLGIASDFYGHQDIVSRYKEKTIMMYTALNLVNCSIVIYGEYAGTLKTGKMIQKQIDYGDSDFYVFDICIIDLDGNIDYIDDDKMELLCKQIGFNTAPLLAIGKPSEIFKLPTAFKSVVIDSNLGNEYTIVESTDFENDNIAEGYVAKPIKFALRPNGKRVIFKCKNSMFLEKNNKTKLIVSDISDRDNAFINEFMSYINDNRLRNVLSKFGIPKPNEFGKIVELLFTDAMDDYDLEHTKLFYSHELVDDFSRCILVLKHSINEFIRPNWKLIFEGDF